jgi:hypothetical protein
MLCDFNSDIQYDCSNNFENFKRDLCHELNNVRYNDDESIFPLKELNLKGDKDMNKDECISPNINEKENNNDDNDDKINNNNIENTLFSEDVGDNVTMNAIEMVSRLGLFAFDQCVFNPMNCDAESQCCEVCKKQGLLNVAIKCSEKLKNMINVNEKSGRGDFERFGEDIYNIIKGLEEIELRESDIINGVWMFDTVIKRHSQCSTFVLLRNNLKIMFLGCLIIAHKISADITYQNVVFVDLLRKNGMGITLKIVNEFEKTILCLLDYDLSGCIKTEKYNSMAKAMDGTEINFD